MLRSLTLIAAFFTFCLCASVRELVTWWSGSRATTVGFASVVVCRAHLLLALVNEFVGGRQSTQHWGCAIPASVQVDNDMTLTPYESEADVELRRKGEEEKRMREEEAKGANDKLRALEVRVY